MDMDFVFATCDFAAADGSHGFFHVEGRFDNSGNFVTISSTQARREFPSRGTILVQNINRGRYGMFKVSEDRHSGNNGGKFKVLPIPSTVYQVLPVPEPRSEVDAVAKRLRSGVKLVPEVGSNTSILILFSDELLCGPLQMRPVDTHPDSFILDKQASAQPIQSWENCGGNSLHKFRIRDWDQIIFATIPEKEPDTFIDLAPTEITLRKVLEAMRACEGTVSVMPHAKIQELAGLLGKVPISPQLAPRIAALANRLKTLEAAAVDFPKLLEKCRSLPSVQAQIVRDTEAAKEAALQDLKKEQAEAHRMVLETKQKAEQLEEQTNKLVEQKRKLEADLKSLNESIESSQLKFNQAVSALAQKAEKDVIGFLAEISVLRPFLSQVPKNPEGPPSTKIPVEHVAHSAKRIDGGAETGVKQLTETLKKHGVAPRSATCAAADVIAALATGQVVTFRGSLATFAATIVAESLFADSLGSVEIPVGTRLQIASFRSGSDGTPRCVVIHGANRSCIDAYGGHLADSVRLRLSGLLPPGTPPHVILSLCEGPSALLPTIGMAELGPIFHTDTWGWVPKASPGSREYGQLEISPIQAALSENPDLLEELRQPLSGLPSTLLLGNARVVLAALTKFHHLSRASKEDAQDQAISSFVNWWIIPFLFAAKASNEVVEACVALAKESDTIRKHVALLRLAQEC